MKKIVVERLKYKYPMSDSQALKDISFEIEEGGFIGLIGQNLSGKSTLCQALVGLVPHFYKGAYGGSVTVDGLIVKENNISELALKAGIVFQNPFTQVTGSKLTVYEEVAFGLENLGVSKAEMAERIDYSLKLLNIYKLKDRRPFDLSGGQTQRMAIAGVIAMRPEIIVLDEPTSQLDPQGSDEVFEAVRELSRQGFTIILAEHKIEKIAQYCQKIIVLKEGRLAAFDTPGVIFSGDNLDALGLCAPVYTNICRRLGVKKTASSEYPVTLDEAVRALEAK